MRTFTIATEDAISGAVARRLLGILKVPEENIQALGGSGNGYLRKKLPSFISMAHRQPVLLLTDLDSKPCPTALIGEWTGGATLPPDLLFRVSVRTIEAWLLADGDELAAFLGVDPRRIPRNPDDERDPKRSLLNAARTAKRSLRDQIVGEKGAIASQGIGYNLELCTFVRTRWDPVRAAGNSPSLARTLSRLSMWAAALGEHGRVKPR